jgi:hypothetical protein
MVKPGDTVVRGQQIAILEAMKMQNSISRRAPARSPRSASPPAGGRPRDPLVRFVEG